VVLKSYRDAIASAGPLLRLRAIRDFAASLIARYDVRGGGPDAPARLLSGGNLQKVVLAREFSGEPRVLVVASPTRGLDVAAIETVHGYLRDAAARGVGVLLISEDLDEILALADRIAVLYEGRVVGERDAETATVEDLGLLMAGGEAAA
jgi:simple sugar transport system ATP-binding protein